MAKPFSVKKLLAFLRFESFPTRNVCVCIHSPERLKWSSVTFFSSAPFFLLLAAFAWSLTQNRRRRTERDEGEGKEEEGITVSAHSQSSKRCS